MSLVDLVWELGDDICPLVHLRGRYHPWYLQYLQEHGRNIGPHHASANLSAIQAI